ncbi:MAG: hypothetical protein RLP02_20310 [Coleofasciculus sp. C2-GNP5-27]
MSRSEGLPVNLPQKPRSQLNNLETLGNHSSLPITYSLSSQEVF